jgi:hypothetical protein
MNFWIDEGKWFLKMNQVRTKWSCEEKIWINRARKFCRKWLGYKFNLDKFYDLIIKLHSKFRKITNWFKEVYTCQWIKFSNIFILFNNRWYRMNSVATFFFSLFWVVFMDLLFVWYLEATMKNVKE